jgi:hypothetical protein
MSFISLVSQKGNGAIGFKAKSSASLRSVFAAILSLIALAPSITAQTLPANRAAPPGIRPMPGITLPPAGVPVSRAYTVVMDRHYATNPPQAGECPREVHDRYWTYGPDGKIYPAWHPPVDPITGCAFGHEHGDDPKLSRQANTNLAFGYVNEKLYELDQVYFRDEDHVGHKIAIARNVEFGWNGSPTTRCDVIIKVHQGTHSRDALSNNLHEGMYYVDCTNGLKLRWKSLLAFGDPSVALTKCADQSIATGPAVPSNSPRGKGLRSIPDNRCLTSSDLTMSEVWQVDHAAELPNGLGGVDFGLYFRVSNASRYVDLASAPFDIARPSDACYQSQNLSFNSPDCVALRQVGQIAWNDPRSPWKGTWRETQINQLAADNNSSTTVWYTDVFGHSLSPSRDVARGLVVEQFIGSGTRETISGSGIKSDYGAPSVRAPN